MAPLAGSVPARTCATWLPAMQAGAERAGRAVPPSLRMRRSAYMSMLTRYEPRCVSNHEPALAILSTHASPRAFPRPKRAPGATAWSMRECCGATKNR